MSESKATPGLNPEERTDLATKVYDSATRLRQLREIVGKFVEALDAFDNVESTEDQRVTTMTEGEDR